MGQGLRHIQTLDIAPCARGECVPRGQKSPRADEERDELAAFELMELHMPPLPTFNYIPILVNLQECFMYPHGI